MKNENYYSSNIISEVLKNLDSSDICKILKGAEENLQIAIYDAFDYKHRLALREQFSSMNIEEKEAKNWNSYFILAYDACTEYFELKNIPMGNSSISKSLESIFEDPQDLVL